MSTAFPLISAAMELNQFSERLAKASSLLSRVGDEEVQLASTPREQIAQIGERALYRIALEGPKRMPAPVLVVYAMVGRWTILDLQDDRSFVRNLVEAGCQVYVLDWGHPTPADRYDDFGDLVNMYMDSFVNEICKREGIEQINLLGICQGGVLSMLYAALHPAKVRNLVTLVTPVDFHADQTDGRPDQGFMNVWVRGLTHEDVDSLIDALGNIPGEVGGAMFSMMTPVRSLAKYNLTLLEVGQDREKLLNFLRMEKWLADRPAHPGEAARQWLKDLYQDNKLVKGELVVGNRKVDLKNLTMPVLNIFSELGSYHSVILKPRPAARGRHERLFGVGGERGAYRHTCRPFAGKAARTDRWMARRPMMMQRVTVDGVSLAYEVRGSGPPLVLIMGYRLNSSAWPVEFVEGLAEQFTVVLFDNRGTGLSDKPTSGYALSNMAEDVIGLMGHLGITQSNVLGYSMGGAIAQELVCRHPERVSSLVLFATLCGGPRAAYAGPTTMRVMHNLERMTPEEAARRIWAVTYEPRYLAANRDKIEWQMQLEIENPTPLHAADLQFQALVDFDCSKALPDVRARTLIVTGDRDQLNSSPKFGGPGRFASGSAPRHPARPWPPCDMGNAEAMRGAGRRLSRAWFGRPCGSEFNRMAL